MLSTAELASFPGLYRRRQTWVGKDGNVRFDGKSGSLMGVFDAAPVVPPSPNPDGAPGSGAGDVKRRHRGGNLMSWLEEYLRRVVFVVPALINVAGSVAVLNCTVFCSDFSAGQDSR